MKDWSVFQQFVHSSKVDFYFGFHKGSLQNQDCKSYKLKQYDDWLKKLRQAPSIVEADLVLSDNLTGLLAIRPDTLLFGSFLWHDLIAECTGNYDALEICRKEIHLLDLYKPTMFCIGEMVMPEVSNRCRPVNLSWLCKKAPRLNARERSIKKVFITGGASYASHDWLQTAVTFLSASGAKISLDPSFPTGAIAGTYQRFTFSQEEFQSLDLIICRPGIGILTDAIQYGIPILAVDDGSNKEIAFNARRVQTLNYGLSWNVAEPEQFPAKLEALKSFYDVFLETLEQATDGGITQASRELLSRLSDC